MKKIALLYSFNSNKTRLVAEKIANEFTQEEIVKVDVETVSDKEFLSYDNYILGVPTWFDGELPGYWDEMVPALEDMNLEGKTFAIFGLGNQKEYPENFADGIGIMANLLEGRGAKIVGITSTDGYKFESSLAVRDGRFLGLALDQENQGRLTKTRIKKWVDELQEYFK